jgi:hypothetical protein
LEIGSLFGIPNMTSLAVPFFTWSISASDEVESPRGREFQQQGWKGFGLNCLSVFERDAIWDFLGGAYLDGLYPEHYFHGYTVDDTDLEGYGNADLPEAELWLPADADEQPFYDFLATIPPRTIEFATAALTEEMETLLGRVNHLVVEYEDDIDLDNELEAVGYLISMEDDIGLVSQLKQMAA